MGKFDFDRLVSREHTNSLKWDEAQGSLPLWVADMDFPTAPAVREVLEKRAAHGIYGYTVVPDEWYQSIIDWWLKRHSFEIKKEWLQFATGVVPAISSMVKRLTNVGDKVVLLTPVYDIFFHSVENAGRQVSECRLKDDGTAFNIDFANLEQKLADPPATLFILCNPHNPTGRLWTEDELCRIGELCLKHGVTVISDEIHCDITRVGKNYVPFASVSAACRDNSVTCISASKAFNLAGLQSAAVFAANEKIRNAVSRGLNSDEVAEPNCFAVDGTVAAFTQGEEWLDELRAYIDGNMAFAKDFIENKLEFVNVRAGDATYLLWADLGKITDNTFELCAFLNEKYKVKVSAGGVYRGGGDPFVRINLACPQSRLEEGLDRFCRGAAEYAARIRNSRGR